MRRGGLYAVAGVSLALAVVVMAVHGYVGDHLARHAGERPGADAIVTGGLVLENLLIVALAVAFVVCGAASRAPWLFRIAALALVLEPVVDVVGCAPDQPIWRLSRMLLVLGHAGFAVAALRQGGARRLAMTQLVLTGAVAMIAMRATASPFTLLVPIEVLTCCIALDLLKAFPAPWDGIPVATVRGGSARLATVTALGLIGCGLAMFAVARELVVELGRSAGVEVVLGTACAVPGVLMIWRLRGRRVWIPIVVAIVVTITVVFDIASLPYTQADEIPLQTMTLPGFAIDLPHGYDQRVASGDDRRFAYSDVGWIERTPGRANLERVAISWGYRQPPVIEEPTFTRKSYVDGVEVKVTSSRLAAFAVVDLVWSCDHRSLIDARMVAPVSRWLELDQLAIRVTDSIRCLDAPPAVPEFEPLVRADLQPVVARDQLRRYLAPDGTQLWVTWTIDRGDLADQIKRDPSRAFVWIGGPTTGIEVGEVGVDGERRVTAESTVAGEHRVVEAWHCGPVSVAAAYVGSTSTYRGLDLLSDIHCP